MTLVLFSDPHLGLTRTANTTPSSRKLLRVKILSQLTKIAMTDYGTTSPKFICGGDVFDSYSNPEEVIKEGGSVVEGCVLTLAGNHDVEPDADKMGSLQFINSLEKNDDSIVIAGFNEVLVDARPLDGHYVVSVPHHTTQALFEKALATAWIEAQNAPLSSDLKILLLHCNYESPYEQTETTLNLTKEKAEDLLTAFDFIFLGHEHQPRDLFDGRLKVLGNIHPTGFSDISDKRIIVIEGRGVTSHVIWNARDNYNEYAWDGIPERTDESFVRIVGSPEAGALAKVARDVRKLWNNSDHLCAVKIATESSSLEAAKAQTGSLETLPQRVRNELASRPALLKLWEEFTT